MKSVLMPVKYIVMILMAFLLVACDDDDDEVAIAEQSIVDVAVANGSFTTLVAALQATGLDQTLDDPDAKFTVFAPTDAAFEVLGAETINALLADTETLSSILTYHVLSGEVDSAAAIASAGNTVETVNGASIALSLDGNSLLVNTATVISADVEADNGIIHVIDAVLLPPTEKGQPMDDIVSTAVNAGTFSTLVTALQATGLDQTLSNPDAMFTVFAPTDEAFNKLGADTVNALLADTEQLSAILLQHVVEGQVDAVTAMSLNGKSAVTVGGKSIAIEIDGENDALKVGGATVITKDLYTTNGIIHVIDTVITEAE